MATIGEILKGGKLPEAPKIERTDGWRRALRGDEITVAPVEWVWRPYIPNGMVTMLTGDPSAGKGWVTFAIGAALSRGVPLPGQGPLPPCRSLYLGAEDSLEHVSITRLKLQGADLSYTRFEPYVFNLTKEVGLEKLRRLVTEETPRIVFIDPITSYMGDQDPNKPTVVNEFMSHLAELAREVRVAIVAVRHRRKPADGDRKGRDPKFGGLGSIGFQGGARSELLVGMTEEGQRALSHEKTNVGPEGETQAFSLDPEDGHLTWEGARDDISGWDLVGKMKKKAKGPGRPAERMEEACAWLRSALAGGRRMAPEVYAEAQKAGLVKKTVSQAKGVLGVRVWNEGGVWWLELPHA